jgi:hypothetical protein
MWNIPHLRQNSGAPRKSLARHQSISSAYNRDVPSNQAVHPWQQKSNSSCN